MRDEVSCRASTITMTGSNSQNDIFMVKIQNRGSPSGALEHGERSAATFVLNGRHSLHEVEYAAFNTELFKLIQVRLFRNGTHQSLIQ